MGATMDGPVRLLPFPPGDVPAFLARLIEHLSAHQTKSDFEFESLDIERLAASGAYVINPGLYRVANDPEAADVPYGEVRMTEALTRLTEQIAAVREVLHSEWGQAIDYQLFGSAPDWVPGKDLVGALATYRQQAAELWRHGGWVLAATGGWLGLPGVGLYAQLLVLLEESAPAPVPREFVFTAAQEAAEEVSAPEAVEAFVAFFAQHHATSAVRIEDRTQAQSLIIDLAHGVATWQRGGEGQEPRYQALRSQQRGVNLATWFLELGERGLSGSGAWREQRPTADADGDDEGRVEAGLAQNDLAQNDLQQNEDAALSRLGAAWADEGCDDTTGDYCVFLEGRELVESQDSRAQILADLVTLGMEPVVAKEPGPDGAVWVRYDRRLRREVDKWV